MKNVLIIGAGISGLSLAFRLQQLTSDIAITVLEQDDRPGGTAWTLRENGFQVEIGPNGFLDTKPTTVNLARDVGLGDKLLPANDEAGRNRFLLLAGKLKLLPGSLPGLLRSDLLSWRGKIALFLERVRSAKPQADESIDSFARRRAGHEVAKVFADALVTGIYAGDPQLLSLPACFPRLASFEREHGSVLKGFAETGRQRRSASAAKGERNPQPGRMWSFREGLRLLSETLAGVLRNPPLLGVTARRIEKTGDPVRPAWIVHGDGRDRWPTDVVVLACPAFRQASLVEDLDVALSDEIGRIPYNRVAVVALGYRREDVPTPPDGFGFIAPQHLKRDVLGVQWCSSIFPERAPRDTVLLRALCGGWHRADVVAWDDDRLLAAMRHELHLAQKINAVPIFHKIIRWDRAIPQYHVGHLARLARIERRLLEHPGLLLAGNAYRGVALNDCTEQGGILAERIRAYLV